VAPHHVKNPRYVRAKLRVMDMAREILRRHREEPVTGRAPDLIDDLLRATTLDGKPLPEAALIAATVGPMIAGIDTAANTLSFLLYSLLKNPDALARVRADVDRVPANETPTFADFKEMHALHGAALETLRMYPVAFAVPRTSVADFEFEGFAIPKHQEVFVASGVTHYLPEFFPEPYKFDIERYDAPRNEHRKAGVFVPYGLGAHTCLGAGMAEVIIMFTTALLLRTVEITLDPSDYILNVRNLPLPRPDNRFGMRVVTQR
jgi:cytochrome P450